MRRWPRFEAAGRPASPRDDGQYMLSVDVDTTQWGGTKPMVRQFRTTGETHASMALAGMMLGLRAMFADFLPMEWTPGTRPIAMLARYDSLAERVGYAVPIPPQAYEEGVSHVGGQSVVRRRRERSQPHGEITRRLRRDALAARSSRRSVPRRSRRASCRWSFLRIAHAARGGRWAAGRLSTQPNRTTWRCAPPRTRSWSTTACSSPNEWFRRRSSRHSGDEGRDPGWGLPFFRVSPPRGHSRPNREVRDDGGHARGARLGAARAGAGADARAALPARRASDRSVRASALRHPRQRLLDTPFCPILIGARSVALAAHRCDPATRRSMLICPTCVSASAIALEELGRAGARVVGVADGIDLTRSAPRRSARSPASTATVAPTRATRGFEQLSGRDPQTARRRPA